MCSQAREWGDKSAPMFLPRSSHVPRTFPSHVRQVTNARATTKEQNLLHGKKYTNSLSLSLLRAHTRRAAPRPPLNPSSSSSFSTTTSSPGLHGSSSSPHPPPPSPPHPPPQSKNRKAVACFTTRKKQLQTKSSTLKSPGTLSHEPCVTNPKHTCDHTQVTHALPAPLRPYPLP